MTFTPRLDAPSIDDLHWIKTTHGGYNRCILIDPDTGSVLPNCTGYAWGRFIEEQGLTDCNLSRGNATVWYGNTSDGYNRGSTPKLGAVICYSGGSDNAGHVAVVEEIANDGTLTISESTYSGIYFRTKTVSPPFYYWGTLYDFQGFIYPDVNFDGDKLKHKFNWVLFSNQAKSRKK